MNSIVVSESLSQEEGALYDRLSASVQGMPKQEAILKVKEFLVTFPSFALAHNDLGVLYHQSGNPTLALAHYEKAARLQPDNTLLRKNLADFYAVELGWIEDAVDIYLEVVKRNPRDIEALIALGQLGTAMAGSGRLDTSSAHFQVEMTTPAFSLPPETPQKSEEELYQDAQKSISQGDLAAAREQLELLAARYPGNALYQNDLGVIRYKSGDCQAAQRHYEDAHRLQPDNSIFARNLADLYFAELNMIDEAIHIYLELLHNQPRDVETLINIGHICSSVGRPDEAKSFYRRALEIEPWNTDARQALAGLQQTVQQQPLTQPVKSVDELITEARALMPQGEYLAARNLLEQAIAQNPYNAVAHNDLGVVAYSMGDVGAAQVAYEQAVKLDPANNNFRKNLADLYFVAVGRPDDAIYIYLHLFRQNPRDIEILSALGQICQAVGRPDEARSFYRRALEVEPWNCEVREMLQR
ncbi:Tetratricopeptide repeat-containing protein [Trichlorobacter thiogenes]|uniref:Tetratricopeptide repeat-containing protein n=1 Tax=Trichlorobacter thiogenes TaxID=115783 RepID=A0A1T4JXI0_9BACT|nr:tetratricopeptide repeat protein [Trichlorobacter thiogenes]SJZ34853.1 Tetratricopeptide repeat-containing protein [Trichlorobacter thiogenes]